MKYKTSLAYSMVGMLLFGSSFAANTLTPENIHSGFTGKMDLNYLTLDDAVALSQRQALQLIDCRSTEFFNGWPEPGASRGGHLPGAISFDADWMKALEPEALTQLLKQKGLEKEKPTVVYCSQNKAKELQNTFSAHGFSFVATLSEPVSNYTGDLVALPRYEKLVSARWLKDLIDNRSPANTPARGYKVVEVAWGPPAKYTLSHIPGALYLNTNDIEAEPWWNRLSDEKLAQTVANLGIQKDTPVILYGRDNTAAARAASILMYLGVEDVRLLDGGWKAWVQAGYPSEPLINHAQPVTDFGASIPAGEALIIDVAEAKKLLAQPETSSLVSIRSWKEFIGETSGYNYIKPKGRIPGAKWGHAGSDPYHMQAYRNPDNTMRSANEIEAFWNARDISKDQRVSFYCGTGWRASEAFFYAWVMGWDNISVFDGGWYEWSGDKANPTTTGASGLTPPKNQY